MGDSIDLGLFHQTSLPVVAVELPRDAVAVYDSNMRHNRSEDLIARVRMLVQRVRREQVAVDGISNVELHVLTVIGAASHPLRPGQLCDELHMTTPNMAATLRKLEALRLIVREQDPTDGRQRLVLATETGRRLVEETRAVRHAWLGDAMGRPCDTAANAASRPHPHRRA